MQESAPRKARGRSTCLVSLIGNLGADPEMRFTQSGVAFTTFNVAVNSTRRGRDGQDEDHTDWFRVTAWRGLAEVANNYLQRGSQVFVHGRFRTSMWQNREGKDQTSLEITANELQLLGRPRDEAAQSPSREEPSEHEDVDPDDLPF